MFNDLYASLDETKIEKDISFDFHNNNVSGFNELHSLSSTFNIFNAVSDENIIRHSLANSHSTLLLTPIAIGLKGRFQFGSWNTNTLNACDIIFMLRTAIIVLPFANFKIRLISTDGASINMKAQQTLCTHHQSNYNKNNKKYRCAFMDFIYFCFIFWVYDFCHVIKNLRNNLCYSQDCGTRKIMTPDRDNNLVYLNFLKLKQVINDYFDHTGRLSAERGQCLAAFDAFDSNFTKMKVSLATCMFSCKMQQLFKRVIKWLENNRGNNLHILSQQDCELINIISAVLPYMKSIDKMFDICNGRDKMQENKLIVGAKIKPLYLNCDSVNELNTLIDVPNLLENNAKLITNNNDSNNNDYTLHKNFFTWQTQLMTGVTCHGFVSFVSYYCGKLHPHFSVCLRNGSSDALERHYGNVKYHCPVVTALAVRYAEARASTLNIRNLEDYISEISSKSNLAHRKRHVRDNGNVSVSHEDDDVDTLGVNNIHFEKKMRITNEVHLNDRFVNKVCNAVNGSVNFDVQNQSVLKLLAL